MRLPDLSRLSTRRKRPALTRDEALAARPLRNPVISWERQENGRVLLMIPLEVKPWMKLAGAVMQLPSQRQIELDEVGSDVWEWCDGEADVAALTARLTAEHKLNPREAAVSLTEYLQSLARRRLLGFALPAGERREEPGTDQAGAGRE